MEIYPDKPLGNVLQIAVPRAPRFYTPGGTMHVVARCNNQEFSLTTPDDFEILMDHLREMARAYEVSVQQFHPHRKAMDRKNRGHRTGLQAGTLRRI